MDERNRDQVVGGVAVEDAHEPGGVPLIVGYVFDGIERFIDPGAEEDEQIDAARDDDPVEEEAERAEVQKRIPLRRKRLRQQLLGLVEQEAQRRDRKSTR